MTKQRHRIAIIGAGAAGLTAAYLLQRLHDVTLYEKGRELGGHAQTIVIDQGPDAGTALDVGFMVLNRGNYPTLYRLLGQLDGVETADCEMSFAYYAPSEQAGYVVNRGGQGIQGSDAGVVRDLLPGLLPQILRFRRQALQDLEKGGLGDVALGDYLGQHRVSPECVNRYVLAMGAAIWSTPPGEMLAFPAASFLQFFNNHGMLSFNPPQWQYVKGGSRRYVQAIARQLRGPIHTGADVRLVVRTPDGIRIQVAGLPPQDFDFVVLAVHGDQALRLLADPTETERRALGAWKYQDNQGCLHTDDSVMPSDRRLWASWNYRATPTSGRSDNLQITYHLNRLQGHFGTERSYFVTLNPAGPIASDRIICPLRFTHPTFTFASMRGRAELLTLNGANRTFYCGSYFGYGFHEDAVRSGVAAASAFGIDL